MYAKTSFLKTSFLKYFVRKKSNRRRNIRKNKNLSTSNSRVLKVRQLLFQSTASTPTQFGLIVFRKHIWILWICNLILIIEYCCECRVSPPPPQSKTIQFSVLWLPCYRCKNRWAAAIRSQVFSILASGTNVDRQREAMSSNSFFLSLSLFPSPFISPSGIISSCISKLSITIPSVDRYQIWVTIHGELSRVFWVDGK